MYSDSVNRFILVSLALLGLSFTSHASNIETFDTAADMNALLDLDVMAGDFGTIHWTDPPFPTPSVIFNYYFTPNSISLKDDSLSIFSFEYAEYIYEDSTGNNWDWNFYDGAGGLIGSLGYVNTGDSSIQTMDLLSLGLSGVNTVQLTHPNGWMAIDNLEYGVSAVPVPAAIWLFGTGILGLMVISKRSKAA